MSNAIARQLRLSSWERGNPTSIVQKDAPLEDVVSHPGVSLLAGDLERGGQDSEARIAYARANAPGMLRTAQGVQRVRAAVFGRITYTELKNGKILASSIGADKTLSDAELGAVTTAIMGGTPPFEPRVFSFDVEDATTFVFYPAFALSAGAGGPLPDGVLMQWVASHVRLSASALNAQPGIQATLEIQYGPPSVPGQFQSLLFELGGVTEPVEVSQVHGVITSGEARLQNRLIAVNSAAPIPGTTFPAVRVRGLPTAVYQAAYRFMIPGDYPTDRLVNKSV